MNIPPLLDRPPPRTEIEVFLAPARKRVRTTLIVLMSLFGLPVLMLLVFALAKGTTRNLGVSVGTIIVIATIVGVGCLLFVRQDVALGRRLLVHGRLAEASVLAAGITINNQSVLTVGFEQGGRRRELAFRVPLDQKATAAYAKQTIPLLYLEGDEGAVGLVLDSVGIVTTR